MSTHHPQDNDWIQVASGQKFHFRSPRMHEIVFDDVAQGLAMQCRFNGQTKGIRHFYTVAQHCTMMAWIVPKEAKLWALLHDAAEAYLSDIPRPIKHSLGGVNAVEDAITQAICHRIGYYPTPEIEATVKIADNYMAIWEAERLLANPDLVKEWGLAKETYPDWCRPPQPDNLHCWARGEAMTAWKGAVKAELRERGLSWRR